jgi:hypothetical protein
VRARLWALKKVVSAGGIEPPTYGLTVNRNNFCFSDFPTVWVGNLGQGWAGMEPNFVAPAVRQAQR